MKIDKSNFPFLDTDIKAMQYDSEKWAGIYFTEDQIKTILSADPDGYAEAIWDDFEKVGHPSGEYGMDTAVRDLWFSAIAYYYVGRDWPIYGDGEEYSRQFFIDFIESLDNNNIKYN